MPVLLWMLGNWRVFAILGGVVVIFGFGSKFGYDIRDVIAVRADNKRIEESQKAQLALNAKSTALETELAALRQSNRRINALLDNELKHPGYSCPVPVNGLQLLRETVAGKPAS